MKYIFIELETDLEEKVHPGVYTKDTREEAMALFHRSLGNHLANKQNYAQILCVVLQDTGFVEASQRYDFRIYPDPLTGD